MAIAGAVATSPSASTAMRSPPQSDLLGEMVEAAAKRAGEDLRAVEAEDGCDPVVR
jgi:hypothetical protein